MLKKFFLGLLSCLMLGQFAFAALPASAACDLLTGNSVDCLSATNLGNGTGAVTAGQALPQLVGRIVRIVLGLLGLIFLILMVYAGFKWMTARGEEGPVTEAKDTIRSAVIGLLIVFLAYALTGFIIDAIIRATAST